MPPTAPTTMPIINPVLSVSSSSGAGSTLGYHRKHDSYSDYIEDRVTC